jgi:hypothetical protein
MIAREAAVEDGRDIPAILLGRTELEPALNGPGQYVLKLQILWPVAAFSAYM